ncbi:MAG: RNA polymerase sigma factor [Phycisphaerae bacterium]
MNRSDVSLILACLEGQPTAWNALVERYARLVYSVINRNRLSSADAEDAFQGVFLSLYRNLQRLQDHACVSAWLITTTHRECWRLSRLARKNATLDTDVASDAEPSSESIERDERQHLVQQALTQLGGSCEKLLRALFFDSGEPDYETIATRLDMRVGSIGPTRARCFKKLEGILGELGIRDGGDLFDSE